MFNDDESAVAVFHSHSQVDAAVKSLASNGFDMKKLSVVGKDYYSDEQVLGFYNASDRVKFWGKFGAFWGGLSGTLFSAALLAVPVFGHIIILGPLASMLVSGVSGAAMTGGFSALGAALYSLGIPKDSIVRYEAEVRRDRFLLLVHGSVDDVARAKTLLAQQGATAIEVHGSAVTV